MQKLRKRRDEESHVWGSGSGKCLQIRTLIFRPSNPLHRHLDIKLTLFTLKWSALSTLRSNTGLHIYKVPRLTQCLCPDTLWAMLPLMVITCISSCPCHHGQCPVLQNLIWISQANFHPNINNKLHPAPSHGDTCSVFWPQTYQVHLLFVSVSFGSSLIQFISLITGVANKSATRAWRQN